MLDLIRELAARRHDRDPDQPQHGARSSTSPRASPCSRAAARSSTGPLAGLTADDLAHLIMSGRSDRRAISSQLPTATLQSARADLKETACAHPIIIDTDPGQDDAVAILLALAERRELDSPASHGRRQRAARADHAERAAHRRSRAARRRAGLRRREPAAAVSARDRGIRLRRRRARRRGSAAAARGARRPARGRRSHRHAARRARATRHAVPARAADQHRAGVRAGARHRGARSSASC